MSVQTLIPEFIPGDNAETDGDVMVWRAASGTTPAGWQRMTLAAFAALISPVITKQPPTIVRALIDVGDTYQCGGHLFLEGTFTAAQVGKSVIITLGPGPIPGKSDDELDSSQMDLVGTIVSTGRMLVRWFAVNPVRGQFRVHYVIGS